MGPGLRASDAATGRVNLYATARGVLRVAAQAVNAVNRIDPAITLATLQPFALVEAGAMVATIKIIPYAVSHAQLVKAEGQGAGALSLAPVALSSASLIETLAGKPLGDKGQQAVAQRLDALGVALLPPAKVPHDETALARALTEAKGALILILTASATSDSHDVAPAALRRAGGRVHHYGMPVDPGNLLFIGDLAGRPVIGLPGCARSPALNGADWVLRRVVCGVPVTGDDIMGMGVGGLLKEIPTRPRPREAR
jgi:molybdenum cofactor cytidylyltransferase